MTSRRAWRAGRSVLRAVMVVAAACACGAVRCTAGRVIDFEASGGVAGAAQPTAVAINNSVVLNSTLGRLMPGDTLVVPNKTFVFMGGVLATGLVDATVQLDGTLKLSDDIKAYPRVGSMPVIGITFDDSTGLTLTSSGKGTLDGNGDKWWGLPGVGYLQRGKNRPPLLSVNNATNFLLEQWLLLNSPRFHFISSKLNGATIRYADVSARRTGADSHSVIDLTAFNTDGFDLDGRDIHVHDCSVWNQDDTFCIKSNHGVTENVVIERVHASGVGLSIGSIGGNNSVRNITFRDVTMHHSDKGIYMKFRARATGLISDVLYENVVIDSPSSWPIWIGPAQQDIKGNNGPYNPCHGDPCSLCWPSDKHANCDMPPGRFANIVLRNISIINPSGSPGVIFGNATAPMKNVTFDSVRFTNPPANGAWGRDYFYCKGVVQGVAIGNTWPVPPCFVNRTL